MSQMVSPAQRSLPVSTSTRIRRHSKSVASTTHATASGSAAACTWDRSMLTWCDESMGLLRCWCDVMRAWDCSEKHVSVDRETLNKRNEWKGRENGKMGLKWNITERKVQRKVVNFYLKITQKKKKSPKLNTKQKYTMQWRIFKTKNSPIALCEEVEQFDKQISVFWMECFDSITDIWSCKNLHFFW